jgi:hypothetical protein
MVFLATTRRAFDECVALRSNGAIWVSGGIVSDAEAQRLRTSGLDLTRLAKPIAHDDPVALSNVLETIREHHPDQTIWVAM